MTEKKDAPTPACRPEPGPKRVFILNTYDNSDEMSSIFKASQHYIDAGIHVFPLNGNKEPIAKAWNDRDFTVDEIRQYGAKGIGTCPGRWQPFQVMVFDIDGPDGRESWASCVFDIGELPETLSVKTGRPDGGQHFYFRVPDDLFVKSNSKIFAPGIDIRGTRGQSVIPPTKHKSGKIYQWHYKGQSIDELDLNLIAELPDKYIDALIERNCAHWPGQEPGEPTEAIDSANIADSDRALGNEKLKTACQKIRESQTGGQHACRYSMGRWIGGYLHRYIDENEAYKALGDAVRDSGAEDLKKAMKDIKDGLLDGRKMPLEIEHSHRAEAVQDDITVGELLDAAYDGQKGCANLFIRLNKNRFVYDHAADQWYEFQGHYWVLETLGRTIKELDKVQALFQSGIASLESRAAGIETQIGKTEKESDQKKLKAKLKSINKQIKALRDTNRNLNTLNFRKQVIEFAAQGQGSLGISGEEWDRNPWVLACQNGIIDLKTGELHPGKPEDYIKQPSPTAYDPDAKYDEFLNFLFSIFDGDCELVDFCQMVFGMASLGLSFLKQYLIILSGAGRNGKDTLLSIIGYVLGEDLAGPIASEMVLDNGPNGRRTSSGPSADIMRLRGMRLAWATETSDGRRFDAGVAKQLTGGGSITGRPPYGRRQITFEQSHLIFILTNNRPHAPVDDYAFWQRIKNIPFSLSFVDDPQAPHERQKDPNILEKIRHEAPGILNWLVQGCLRYLKYGLQEPEPVKAATAEYRRDEDLLAVFIEDACFVGPNAEVRAKDFYDHYKKWAKFNNHKPLSGTAFGRKMASRFSKEHKNNGKFYTGIGLINEFFEEFEGVNQS